MNVTKEVITDLFPLYVANECSKDSRVLVERYLQQNPSQAEELRRVMDTAVPGGTAQLPGSTEVRSLREARRRVRHQSWLMGLAIFFSLAPFSFLFTGGKIYWVFRESPGTAAVYALIGIGCWSLYCVLRSRSKILSNL
jgi:hypothetical protein